MSQATTAPAFDQTRSEVFSERLLEIANSTALALMGSLGHRTGLFDTMAGMPAATSQQIADRAGLNERYVREWLGAMTTGGIVEHDPEANTYRLPAEHAAWLTRAASPNNIAVLFQYFPVLGAVEEEVLRAFKDGKGVPYSAYPRFHEVMAEDSAQTTLAGLFEQIIPSVEGLDDRLERGADVMDLGCGRGRAILALAEHYPASRFVGIDLSDEATAFANAEARARGLTNARFEAMDAATLDLPEAFDVVFTFDAVHDQARPDLVLANIRRSLRPGGVYVMQDIACATRLAENIGHPIAPLIYTISCMHCMSVSLAGEGGMGLGAAWGREKAQAMLAEAGFDRIEIKQLEHDFQNDYYIMRIPS